MTESQRTRIKYFKKLAKEERMTDKQRRIAYFQSLADNLPQDLENRGILYQKYLEHIEKIKKERG